MTAHQCARILIMLPEKRPESAASSTLAKNILSTLIPTVVRHLLLCSKLGSEASSRQDEKLIFLEEDIKTLVMLPTVAPEAESKSVCKTREDVYQVTDLFSILGRNSIIEYCTAHFDDPFGPCKSSISR